MEVDYTNAAGCVIGKNDRSGFVYVPGERVTLSLRQCEESRFY